ncbi:glycosyltransferase family 2 protein [Halohasta salina]|uniref:glycosyltransferase family 2 protein n=1 Tax=Halohasta salina TaxID=2961621 RepID=UPI0020A3EFA9|nr:glycosyltransferase family 2 protein [Halohasta salina]
MTITAQSELLNNSETPAGTSSGDELLVGRLSEQTPTLSIVLPTLNEEEGIAECIGRIKTALEELQLTAEIIVSDSSTDRTPAIARKLGAIVVEPDAPGYGYAYRYAFERTRGEYIIMGDADTTYDFEQIPRLLTKLDENNADMILGSRLNGEIKPGSMPPLHQYIGNPLLTAFLNAFYDAGVSDAHSGFRIFTRDAYETLSLHTTGMEFASEMIMDAGAKDLDIIETPITYHERKGEETLDSFSDGWRHVRFMLLNAPGYLFSGPGTFLTIFGGAIMLTVLSGIEIVDVSLGTHSMIAGSLFTLLGYHVFTFGLFTRVNSNPIRTPNDPITATFTNWLTLERGAVLGAAIFAIGSLHAGSLVLSWLSNGLQALPFTVSSILSFTVIILGAQTIFTAFFLSTLTDQRPH